MRIPAIGQESVSVLVKNIHNIHKGPIMGCIMLI